MKERKIERETHYEYSADGELSSMTINETITNPSCKDCGLIDEVEGVGVKQGCFPEPSLHLW